MIKMTRSKIILIKMARSKEIHLIKNKNNNNHNRIKIN